jgi:hypothetical protein
MKRRITYEKTPEIPFTGVEIDQDVLAAATTRAIKRMEAQIVASMFVPADMLRAPRLTDLPRYEPMPRRRFVELAVKGVVEQMGVTVLP